VIELDQLGIEQQVAAHVTAACTDLPDALALEPGAQEVGEALAGALGPARELVLAAGVGAAAEDELVAVVKAAAGGVGTSRVGAAGAAPIL
jgi:hypothetical protein